MTAHNGNPFRRFWDLGYRRLLPVVPHDCGLRAAGKRPGIKGDNGWYGTSVKQYAATLDDLDRWAAMGAGVGFRCDSVGLLFGLDIDTSSPVWSEKIMRAAFKLLGPSKRRIGAKVLLPYRLSAPMDYQQARFDDGMDDKRPGLIEGLAGADDTKWFVAHGIHPGTGRPYSWPDGVPAFNDLTVVTPEQVRDFFNRLREELPRHASSGSAATDRATVDQPSLKGDLDLIRKAIEATPNDPNQIGYKEWSETAVALRGACQDDENFGLDLFCEWSEKAGLTDETEDAARVYWSFKPPFGLGADFIYSQARRLGGEQYVASAWHDAGAVEPPNEHTAPTESKATPAKRFEFLPFDAAADGALEDTRASLIKGLLDQGAMTVLYGASNVGKTFVAMDLAYHVASGLPYAGMKTTRGCVIYVAAEGGRGAKRRVRALRDKYRASGVQFLLLPSSVDLRRPDADLKPLVSAIQALGVPVMLIVVDTLSRAMAGGDENSSVDMGYIVNHFDVLRSHTSAHLLVVHHSGKNAAQGARGHSLLRAATDTEIEVAEGSIEVTKQRDLDKSWSSGFALEVRTLGVDGDGDPITSCTVRLVKDAGVSVGVATPKEADVLKAMADLSALSVDPAGGVSVAELVEYFGSRADDMSDNAVRVMIKKLAAKSLIERLARGRWGHIVRKDASEWVQTHSSDGKAVEGEQVQMGPEENQNVFE
ncbi:MULTISPECIES: AAA family ATPase [unclassified Mesorhizobium]|uniref:AAA family ATPase n=1 Tax=unclassified Mesorhizobium TaxID=325217 RepID=UPI000FD92CB3|nr:MULTISPECIES: AAA family ATPase [unclassified Mesorhizobium]TGT76172.1 hypothetical protein EN809_000675 [Mesorhizobium sp. M2E.F.Ca.ET.166.01.1.1]TGW02287.1 hypothetical protein EN797_000675 [Mesorhizobium sp. M2E.F.Ca.ET.154.01.1.1]